VRSITIKLWRHEDSQDWSIEVDGILYSHVSSSAVDSLMECAAIRAQDSLLEQEVATLKPVCLEKVSFRRQ
jgi:hypothetical protein